jgi:hypothetical protein
MSSRNRTAEKEFMPGMAAGQSFWGEWLQRQGFAQMQGAAERWMRHRSEEYQKGIAAATQMAACKDVAQAAAIQQQWLADCTQSLIADWMALMSPAMEGVRHHTGAAERISEETST